jgi:hypothetical protein
LDNHSPYETRLGRRPDFRVKYKFLPENQGGRHSLPYQGIRSDFWYEHPDHKKGMLFMIWPEFEDERGEVILDNTIPVPAAGTARMWIITEEFISYHRGRIKIGTIGYFKEGSRTTGECQVLELINIA